MINFNKHFMSDSIKEVDLKFDLGNVFKRNYCTLLNIKIFEVEIKRSFWLDGVEKSLSLPNKVHGVFYREYRNPNWFELVGPEDKKECYWTSIEDTQKWMSECIKYQGLEKISEMAALKIIEEN